MSALTGQQAVNQILTLLAVLQPGETPNTSESNDALIVINNVIDNWAIQRLQNVGMSQTSISLTNATQSYTLSPVPPAIVACTFIDSNGATFPLKQLNAEEWDQIVDRNITANIVKGFFFDRISALWLTPAPKSGTVVYSSWPTTTAQFSSLGGSNTLANGYQRALIAAAALELAPQYAVPAANLVQIQQSYQEAMSALRQLNAEILGPEPAGIPPSSNVQAPPTSPSGSPGA
jgi:hypothetical protein